MPGYDNLLISDDGWWAVGCRNCIEKIYEDDNGQLMIYSSKEAAEDKAEEMKKKISVAIVFPIVSGIDREKSPLIYNTKEDVKDDKFDNE